MIARVVVDKKGRITIPRELREILNIKVGDELLLKIENGRIVIEKTIDPYKILEEVLEDITFTRSLRKLAEREAVKEILENERK